MGGLPFPGLSLHKGLFRQISPDRLRISALQKNDKLMNDWIKYNSLKSVVVLTKIDLISKNDINSKIKYYENNLESKVFLFSNKFKRFNDLILTEFDKYIVQ